ncbi:MAG TPA: ABC transporter permease, partial [Phnomibacter sp.]|nr:ABC transporter permease [Phnomibacter sp.]
MIKNFLIIAWRNLLKAKGYSLINIGGLAVGMAVTMLIGFWVYDELSFNKYHDNYERIAQVLQSANFNGKVETQTAMPAVMGPELREKYGSEFKYVVQSSWIGEYLLTIGDKQHVKQGIFFEPDAPDMLSLKMEHGTSRGLEDPYSVLLSASASRTIFGKEDPIGKVIRFNRTDDVKVTGVFEDLPQNSSFARVEMILPWQLWLIQNPWVKQMQDPWGSNFSQTFVQLADHGDVDMVSSRIRDVKMHHISEEEKRYQWVAFLHPMSKWHLYNEFKNGINTGGDIRYVRLFGLIGVFVLLLACINFMNLATARSEKRALEVG